MSERRAVVIAADASVAAQTAVHLADAGWVTRAGTPSDGPEPRDASVIVVRTDPTTPTGKQAIANALEQYAPAAVVAVLDAPTRRAQRTCMELGVHGVVPANRLDGDLASAAAAVATGQIVLTPELAERFRRPALSPREKQVLALVVLGLSNAEIAQRLFVTESTVKSHLSASFEKLGVRSRREAASLIVDGESGLGTGILRITGGGKE